MAYIKNKTWAQWELEATQGATRGLDILSGASHLYAQWQLFRDGRTDLAIATALGVDESQIAELDLFITTINDIYLFCTGTGGMPAANRISPMRPFV